MIERSTTTLTVYVTVFSSIDGPQVAGCKVIYLPSEPAVGANTGAAPPQTAIARDSGGTDRVLGSAERAEGTGGDRDHGGWYKPSADWGRPERGGGGGAQPYCSRLILHHDQR